MICFIKYGDDDYIKIVAAANPEQKVKELQAGSPYPLDLLFTIDGGNIKQKELYEKFDKYRVNNYGWFEFNGKLKDFIDVISLDQDPVVASVAHLVDNDDGFSGTMTELIAALTTETQELIDDWPKEPHTLSRRLKSLEQNLDRQGIYVTRSRTGESRRVEIGRIKGG